MNGVAMRFTVLIGFVVIFAGCTAREEAPADTAAAAAMDAPAGPSLASFAGVWNVNVTPEGRDTVVTTYILNTTDTTAWAFAFPNRPPIQLRVTGRSGDSLMTEAGPFESSLRAGQQVSVTNVNWLQDGKFMSRTTARYPTGGADSVVALMAVGTRQ